MMTMVAAITASETVADPALPQLGVILDRSLMERELERCIYRTSVDLRAIACIRYKPGRRAVLRLDLSIDGRHVRLFAKTFASDRGPAVHRIYEFLSSAKSLRTLVDLPELLGYLPELKLLLQREVRGGPARERLLAGDTALAIQTAEAMHALHGSDVDFQRRHDIGRELDPLRHRVAHLARECPALADRAHECLALVESGRGLPWPWRWRPVHRDFYHDQVLVDGDRLAILDFDDAAMSEPAVDIANFAAHLRLLRIQQPGRAARLQDVQRAFVERWRDFDPDVDARLLSFLEGATLLRLAEIHHSRERGEEIAGRLLHRSLDVLQTAVD